MIHVNTRSEQAFQDAIVDLARTFGWKVAHFAAARTNHGWRTPARYDATGWPDLILVHPEHGIIAAEVKSVGGKPTTEQTDWLKLLRRAGIAADIWRPTDGDQIARTLSAGRVRTWTL